MNPNFDLLFVLADFDVGDDDGDFAGGAKFVYVATDARNKANNSGKRFFNSYEFAKKKFFFSIFF